MKLRKIELTETVRFNADQMLKLVADVASYPEFLPWVKAVKIWNAEENPNEFSAQLLIGYKAFRATFSTDVIIDPDFGTVQTHLISNSKQSVGIFSKPLKALTCKWEFRPHSNGTEIGLSIELEFADAMLAQLAGNNLQAASTKIMYAFTEEAKKRFP